MKLHPIRHTNASNLWCGPAAISAVTGYDTRSVHQCIRELNGLKQVTGLNNRDLVIVLQALGCKVRAYRLPSRVTLAYWLKTNAEVFSRNPVIVNLTGHYVTVMGRKFIDNHTDGPVFLKAAPHRRARVKGYFIIESTDETVTWTAPAAVSYPPGYWAGVKQRATLLNLATTHGISIDDHIYSNEWFVYPPNGFEDEKDPHYGDHLACGAEERSDRIKTYLGLLGVPLPGTAPAQPMEVATSAAA